MSLTYCKVLNCRFAGSHITKAHICGKCKEPGHGSIECGNPVMVRFLSRDLTIIPFDLQCCIIGCKYISTHTTSGHQCTYCKKYDHQESECPERLWQIKVERGTAFEQSESGFKEKKYLKIQARKQMKWNEHKIFTKIYGGMGSIWYARRTNNYNPIELFFMHTDNWGQYGESTDHRPQLNKFLEGFRCVDSD